MNLIKSTTKDIYYTKDHDWIDFQASVAYVGVSSFKLIGFKEIHQVFFNEPSGFKKRGELLATIKYNDYLVHAHMPVDGNVLELNSNLIYGADKLLLKHAESLGWIALIVPLQPEERKGLLLPKQYLLNSKSKYQR